MTLRSLSERRQAGKAVRSRAPRASHGEWNAGSRRRDPVALLECCNRGRLPELTPFRYGRMLRSPFTFLRGSPALMAADLSETPVTGISVQACGDCHLSNFGLFASPERNLVFDINDFDETLRAPWEWDLKRLATSFIVAARGNGIEDRAARAAAIACGRSYREHMRAYSEMSPLEVWYDRIPAEHLVDTAPNAESRSQRKRMAKKARRRDGEQMLPRITEIAGGQHRFIDQPPLMTRITDPQTTRTLPDAIAKYRASLADDRRVVFDRYRLEDVALRVVGVGSVGTRCLVGLFFCDDQNSLLLQAKEARRSVLEPFAEKSPYDNQGQRVVAGQRLVQAASDILLGWFRAENGHDFYVRQMRDMKYSPPVHEMTADDLEQYADVCGWALARAHARSGDPCVISGYLGRSATMDVALADFAQCYADQVECDHQTLVAAQRAGKIEVVVEPTS